MSEQQNLKVTLENPAIRAAMEERIEQVKQEQITAQALMDKDPSLPFLTAMVMAADLGSAERARARVTSGEWTAERGVNLTGSYARLDLAVEYLESGALTADTFFEMLPELWRGADPDDTDPRFLRLWYQAWLRNGRSTVRDGRALPKGEKIKVFRGQMPNDPLGIAWTTDPKIANKFASGAGLRTPVAGGIVYRGLVARKHVLAYLTGRTESEVIIDPRNVEAWK